ncbi:MAG: aminotransferase class I/II-fold pyridoxal phosphate-dependent enzyme [Cytophagales bacterium]|nr:aminotransferase class I/II-fold pyridoxal phosphate-dependent enzyme [Cytophagales bacterium]
MIHGHGSDAYRYKENIVADFSSNVWYPGPPKELIDHLGEALQYIGSYPEPDSGRLQNALARFHHVPRDKVLVTNGSAEAIYLLARVLRKRASVILSPTFAEYEDASETENHKVRHIFRKDLFTETRTPHSLFWICNPNNPDGRAISPEDIKKLLIHNPSSVFIIDEAYGALCSEDFSSVHLLEKHDNLIILKSHTKAFTIPGIRLGYVLGPPKIIFQLRERLFPWNVNTLAISAGLYICHHHKRLAPDKDAIYREMKAFRKELRQNTSIGLRPTRTNYLLGELDGYTAGQLKDYLVKQHGILIRDASNFFGLNNRFVRLALQSPEHNRLLADAIGQFERAL